MDRRTLIKTTQDGRRVEVIGTAICLDGAIEAESLVEVGKHPNHRAIWSSVPQATHMAGRIPLTAEEAATAMRAIAKAADAQSSDPVFVAERMRNAVNGILRFRGDE